MKKILLITTGGTVGQKHYNGALDIDQSKGGSTLVERIIPNLKPLDIERLDTLDLFRLDSSNISPTHWQMMINEILDNYEDYDGFVITHGTDTLPYTCSALAFALGGLEKPVVLTAAQVAYGCVGSDTLMNLENALCIAAQNVVPIRGVICVFGGLIMTGTRVSKVTEFSYNAFESHYKTPLGKIGTRVDFNMPNVEAHNAKYGGGVFNKTNFAMDKIFVFNEFPGINKSIIRSVVDTGVKGIILRNYSDGDSNVGDKNADFENIRDIYEYIAAKNVVLAIAAQPHSGSTTMTIYKTGVISRELGGIPTYDISNEALTVKMGWLLGQELGYSEVRKELLRNIREEVTIWGTGNREQGTGNREQGTGNREQGLNESFGFND